MSQKKTNQEENMGNAVTLELPAKCKPSKVCSTDKTRPVLLNAHIHKAEAGYEIHATNSYVAARVPVTATSGDSEDAAGTLPFDALKRVEGQKHREFVAHNGTVTTDAGQVTFTRAEVGRFPNLDQLWPKDKAENPFRVGLNAKLLHDLAQALGSDSVTLSFDTKKPLRTILVEPLDSYSKASGLIMPIRFDV